MTLRKLLAAVGVLALALGAAAAVKIGPSNIVGMIRWDTRREGALRVGSAAPDVRLRALEGPAAVRIADRIGARPLVLVCGSFT
ncbi:MAG TPA: hypothetical protein VG777_01025 [Thermoanaerobaculia bacterium]|nr:hypothetical protein [Thermoanaerobaculia bacterium]